MDPLPQHYRASVPLCVQHTVDVIAVKDTHAKSLIKLPGCLLKGEGGWWVLGVLVCGGRQRVCCEAEAIPCHAHINFTLLVAQEYRMWSISVAPTPLDPAASIT